MSVWELSAVMISMACRGSRIAPPDRGGVEYQSFHKPSGAAHDLVFLRLADAPGGVGAGVDGDTGVVPVDQQAGDAGRITFVSFNSVPDLSLNTRLALAN